MFVNVLLIAALSIIAPRDGATIPLLNADQRGYLALEKGERYRKFDDPTFRAAMVATGDRPEPLRVAWEGASPVVTLRFERLTAPETWSLADVFTVTNDTSAYLANLELGATYRCTLVDGAQTATVTFSTSDLPPRLLMIDGVDNFRDLGGWKGLDGRKVRQNRIFRSSGLRSSSKNKGSGFVATSFSEGSRRITNAGIDYLKREFKIKTDIELRTKQETVFMTSSVLGGDVQWMKEPFVAYSYIDNFVRGREPFVRIFRKFLDEKNYPILFHCSGGRDRTGTVAYILNGLLGVSEDDLSRDWEASGFATSGMKFNSKRIVSLKRYLDTLGGHTITESCELYAKSCGITDEEIARFRELMLEGEVK